MHPYPICKSCRFPLYKYQGIFDGKRATKYAEIGIDPNYSRVNAVKDVPLGDILDELGIKNPCCRCSMLTGTWFEHERYGVRMN